MPHKFGISETSWAYLGVISAGLLLATTTRQAANVIGSDGIFGYGKSKKLASLGKSRNKTWLSLQALSLGLLTLTMLESSHDSLQRLAQVQENNRLKDIF